jgi:uncharacterized membrane protein
MKKTILIAATAAVAVPMYFTAVQAAGEPTPAPVPKFKSEKCYGVNKAGANDCQTMSNSCAGTARRDRQPDAWIYVPEGVCAKLAGGVAKAKQS